MILSLRRTPEKFGIWLAWILIPICSTFDLVMIPLWPGLKVESHGWMEGLRKLSTKSAFVPHITMTYPVPNHVDCRCYFKSYGFVVASGSTTSYAQLHISKVLISKVGLQALQLVTHFLHTLILLLCLQFFTCFVDLLDELNFFCRRSLVIYNFHQILVGHGFLSRV